MKLIILIDNSMYAIVLLIKLLPMFEFFLIVIFFFSFSFYSFGLSTQLKGF